MIINTSIRSFAVKFIQAVCLKYEPYRDEAKRYAAMDRGESVVCSFRGELPEGVPCDALRLRIAERCLYALAHRGAKPFSPRQIAGKDYKVVGMEED